MNTVFTRGKEIIFPHNTAIKLVKYIQWNTTSIPLLFHEETIPKILGDTGKTHKSHNKYILVFT